MKRLCDFLNEGFVSEASTDPYIEELVKQVVDYYELSKPKDKQDVAEAVKQICEFAASNDAERPTIKNFYTDSNSLRWMRREYSSAELKKILVGGNLISVEVPDFSCYNWNNDDKCWEEI